MKKLVRKTLSFVAASAMAMGMLAGCGASGSGSASEQASVESPETSVAEENVTESQTAAPQEEADIEKPEKITWMVHSGLAEEDGIAEWEAEFERLTGIELEIRNVSNNEYYQVLELAFASGDIPDIFDVDAAHYPVYASQNAIADLTDLFNNSELKDKIDSKYMEAIELDGRIYGVPSESISGSVTYVRKDWLDQLGMELPKTYDEFITMLERFRDEIPECQTPLTSAGIMNAMYLPEFYQGANPDFVYVDGQWVDGMQQPNMEQALTNLQNAYAEGLLDPEVITNETSTCRDLLFSGSVGVFNYWAGTWAGRLEDGLNQNFPDAELVALEPIEGAQYLTQPTGNYVINGRLDDDRIAQLFKYFIEYMNDGAEGQVLFSFGVEGVHWEQDGEYVKMLPSLSNPEQNLVKAWRDPSLNIVEFEDPNKKCDLGESVLYSLELAETYGKMLNITPVSETLTKIRSDLQIIKEDTLAKVIMGSMTVEEGLASYKAQAAALGVDQVLAEMNAQ